MAKLRRRASVALKLSTERRGKPAVLRRDGDHAVVGMAAAVGDPTLSAGTTRRPAAFTIKGKYSWPRGATSGAAASTNRARQGGLADRCHLELVDCLLSTRPPQLARPIRHRRRLHARRDHRRSSCQRVPERDALIDGAPRQGRRQVNSKLTRAPARAGSGGRATSWQHGCATGAITLARGRHVRRATRRPTNDCA